MVHNLDNDLKLPGDLLNISMARPPPRQLSESVYGGSQVAVFF